jgi:hypothetical protein
VFDAFIGLYFCFLAIEFCELGTAVSDRFNGELALGEVRLSFVSVCGSKLFDFNHTKR